MKKITLLLFMLTIFVFTSYGQIISQYIEANSGTTPKGIEIWNNTASALDFSANSLVIKKGTNGATPSADYTLSTGTLAPGDVIVIGTSDLQATTEGNGSAFYLKAFTFNGDDALEVWYGSTKTDVFGTPGMDPGSAWSGNGVSTANQNIALLSGITTGDTDGWTDPSTRFETVNTNPSGSGGDEGFGIAPASGSGPDDPSAFTANTVSTSEIDLSWTQNANSDDVMVAWSSDGTFGTPTDGTSYSAGNSITGGGTVLYNGSATTYNHTGLTSGTHYYYKAWSVDGSTNYSSGVTDDATTYKNEPSNHVTGFSATANGTVVNLSWSENDGAVIPDGYIIMANTGTITDPVDGTDPADDTDLTDGSGNVKVAHGTTSYSFTNCSSLTTYNFKIYPYTNSSSAIDFKTSTPVPDASATTGTRDKLFISEVADPSNESNGKFVELYNAGSSEIDLSTGSWNLTIQANAGSFTDFALSGIIHAGETFVTSYSSSNFTNDYGFDSDQNSGFAGNGNDGYFLYKGGDHSNGTLVDAYGVIDQDGAGTAWEYTDSRAVRNSSVTQANPTWTSSEWTISSANVADMTPGTHGDCITFNGSSTSAWGTAGNWVGAAAPTSSNNVKIPAGLTNNPSVDGDATTPSQCNNLTIASGAILTIPVAKALTVNGTLTNNGSAAGLVVQSDATGNGSLIIASGTPAATVQRYIAAFSAVGAADGWHEIGCPVSSYSVSGTDWDPTVTGTNNDLYYWDESQNLWMNYRTATFDFSAGKGYLAANDANLTHVFTGTLNNADITVSGLTSDNNGWNLLGNPFPSAIKWNDGNWTLTNLESTTAKVWDYATNPGNYTDLSANDIIPSTNGFFVQVASGSTGSVTIPIAARTHSSTNNYKTVTATNSETLKIKVTNDQNVYTDITTVGFNSEATDKMDWAFDSHKLFGDPQAPQLWTVSNNEMFSTNYLPYSNKNIEVPLSFKAGVNGIYHLMFSSIGSFDANNSITLEDLQTGQKIDLSNTSSYDFTADKGDDPNRFVLHINGVTAVPNVNKTDGIHVFAYGHTVYLHGQQSLNGRVSIFNTLGQQVYTGVLNGAAKQQIRLNQQRGVYFVRLKENSHVITRKIFIQ